MRGLNQKPLSWLILIALSLIWGSSFILMKRGMDAFTSDEVAAMRISMAFLVLLPLLLKRLKIDFKRYLVPLALTGLFGNLIPAFLFTLAETRISSSLAGMLNALTPMFTIVLSLVWLKASTTKNQIIGVVAGLIAAAALVYFEEGEDKFRNAYYGLLVVIATVCYAVSVNVIKKYLNDLGSITTTVWAFSLTGPIALVYLFAFSDFTVHLVEHPLACESLGYTAILAIMGSALSVIAYNYLIKQAGTVFASSCTYLLPIVAIFWGVLAGETVNLSQILCIGVIILSVYLINKD